MSIRLIQRPIQSSTKSILVPGATLPLLPCLRWLLRARSTSCENESKHGSEVMDNQTVTDLRKLAVESIAGEVLFDCVRRGLRRERLA